jgi:hypothetical protein
MVFLVSSPRIRGPKGAAQPKVSAVATGRVRRPGKPVESASLPDLLDVHELLDELNTHPRTLGLNSWTRENIVAARDLQARGLFKQPWQLIRSAKTDSSIYGALLNRVAPHRGVPRTIEAHGKPPEAILIEAQNTFAVDGAAIAPGVTADICEALAMCGVAVAVNKWSARSDGSRVDVCLETFPMENVEWSEIDCSYIAYTTNGRELITHGDGRWVVFEKNDLEPWNWGAILPLADVWSDRALTRRDRSKNSESHGDDKWIGKLPQGIPINSPQGRALLTEMKNLYNFRRAILIPYGSEVERSEAMGQNYQIFDKIIASCDKDAQRVLLGQDGTMNNAGGNYIKARELFNVRFDIVESDLGAIERGLTTGTLRPWSKHNFGRWDQLTYKYLIPDPDQDARRESIAQRHGSLNKIVKEELDLGATVDQARVNYLAAELGVKPFQIDRELKSSSSPQSGR